MMKKLMVLVVSVLSLATSAGACMNGFGEEFDAKFRASFREFPVPMGHPIPHVRHLEGLDYDKKRYEHGEFEGSIDYGLYLVYDKQYEEAEKVFRKIAQKWPSRYEAAANFGTILEVNGKNEEALKWIKKAIKINPDSHDGSEWIHVEILEAKLNPMHALSGSEMTGVDFGTGDMLMTDMDTTALKKLQKELFFQLNERITFIEPKDPYIAALMMELGNVTLALDQRKDAKRIYALAKKYGMQGELLDKRTAMASSDAVAVMDSVVAVVDSQPTVQATSAAVSPDGAARAPAAPEGPVASSYFNFAFVLGMLGVLGLVIGLVVKLVRRKANRK